MHAADGDLNRWEQVSAYDVPALDGRGDPEWWREWATDPEFGRGWHSINSHLRITGFGINGSTAAAGGELIVPHVEADYTDQEEVYVVLRGRAQFMCNGETFDVDQGGLVYCAPGVARQARALSAPTTVLALGGRPGSFAVWSKPV
ncbi:MAG TPA: hypothetical protein VE777_20220 [Gaiellales bacterium]|nr:hypothetical protein [Gaiellales bacterium]